MIAVDTNILLYVHDPRDPAKQGTAMALLQSITDGVLLWQVACEYLAASRKLEPLGYDRKMAWQDIQDLRAVWATILPGWQALERSQDLLSRFSLSFWDSTLIAASLEAGLARLYTEDFSAYPNIDGLEIVNPFQP